MTLQQFLVGLFAVLILGLLLPLPHGMRMALVLALVASIALAVVDGGVQYLLGLFD